MLIHTLSLANAAPSHTLRAMTQPQLRDTNPYQRRQTVM
jgi:hypothetical protein